MHTNSLLRLMGLSFALVVLLHFAGSSVATAQTADYDEVITLDEALSVALQQNTRVLRAQTQSRLADVSVRDGRMDYLPQLSLSTSGQQRYGRNFLQEEGVIIDQTTEAVGMGVSASMTLFDGFSRSADLAAAHQTAVARQAEQSRTRQDVVFDVLTTFLSQLQQDELISVAEENVELRQAQLDRIEAMIRSGARPASERYQQEVLLAEAEQQLVEAERGALQGHSQLVQLLALNPERRYRFEADDLEAQVPNVGAETSQPLQALLAGPGQYEPAEFIQRARNERADLRARQFDLDAARQGLRSAEGLRWPTISLSGNYGTSWTSASGQPFGAQLDRSRGGSLGLSVSVPLFDRLQARGSVERAEVSLLQSRYDLEDLERQVAVEVREAISDRELAQKSYQASLKRLEAAENALRAAEERYRLGAAPLVELRQATADRASAAADNVRAYYDVMLQQKRLDYLDGTLNVDGPLW